MVPYRGFRVTRQGHESPMCQAVAVEPVDDPLQALLQLMLRVLPGLADQVVQRGDVQVPVPL